MSILNIFLYDFLFFLTIWLSSGFKVSDLYYYTICLFRDYIFFSSYSLSVLLAVAYGVCSIFNADFWGLGTLDR